MLACLAVTTILGALLVAKVGDRLPARPPPGPTPIFPITGVLLALAMLFGLSQRAFRDFGAEDDAAG